MTRLVLYITTVWCVWLSTAAISGEAMRTKYETDALNGFLSLCERTPTICEQGPIPRGRFELTEARARQLADVNYYVNKLITPMTDQKKHGVIEQWDLLDCRHGCTGDCEDYVILKREILRGLGWPLSALLITVVRDEYDEGHAVLTARTTQDDLVLDNKIDEVRPWSQYPYRYVMRQSYVNPRIWYRIMPAHKN